MVNYFVTLNNKKMIQEAVAMKSASLLGLFDKDFFHI